MRKGLVPLILVGITVVGIVGAFVFLTQQSTKVIVTKLTFGEKGLIEDKVRFDSQVSPEWIERRIVPRRLGLL